MLLDCGAGTLTVITHEKVEDGKVACSRVHDHTVIRGIKGDYIWIVVQVFNPRQVGCTTYSDKAGK